MLAGNQSQLEDEEDEELESDQLLDELDESVADWIEVIHPALAETRSNRENNRVFISVLSCK